ncbi:MAG: FtsX-like permease family protein [Gemmatimonadota bacterium]
MSCDFFSVYELGKPLLGRIFLPEECESPGGAPVVVLSERIWRRELAADPRILGTVLVLNRHPFTVVGIAPDNFPGRLKGDFWFPYTAAATFFMGKDYFRDADTPWLTLEGRVRARSSRRDAESELRVIAGRQDRLQRDRETTLTVTDGSMLSELAVETPRLLWMAPLVLGALTLVLLLAGINVTVLLLSRAADRRREIAVRLAVGVGRGRLLRLLLVESLILASIAGTIGAVVAYQMPVAFTRLFPEAPFSRLTPDWTVLAYLGGITLLAGVVAGLAPALEAFRVDLAATLKGQDRGLGSGTRRWRLRDLLIGAQVALSLVLLIGAGIFVHGEQRMAASDPGFETHHVLVVGLRPTRHYDGPEAGAFFEALERRLRAERRIRSVGFASEPPYAVIDEDVSQGTEVRLPSEQNGGGRHVAVTVVSSEYFAALGIPIQRGRGFNPAEDNGREQAHGAVVSESFARLYWPNDNPLGKVVVTEDGASLEVVGVARDTKTERLGVAGAVQLYRTGSPRSFSQLLLVRFDGDVASVANAVRQAVRAGDPDLLADPQTLQFMIGQTASIVWKVASMVLMLGALAVTLAVVGIFGVVSFTVRRRTKELGIRRALGASQSQIVRMVVATGLRPIGAGIAAGLALSAAGSLVLEQTLKAMPLPVEPRDPWAFIAVSALLAATAVAAMLGPALRGARSDPNEALRQE